MRSCLHCGADQTRRLEWPDDQPRFGMAGERRPPLHIADQIFCRECGEGMHRTAPTCPSCGAVQRGRGMRRGSGIGKSRLTAALLAFFLGGFGVHRFYLGQVAAGTLYLLFFWTLIPGLIALVEFIFFLSMSDETFAERYG